MFMSTHDSKKEQNGQFINAMKNCYDQMKRKPDGFESSVTQKSVENMLKCVKNGGTVKQVDIHPSNENVGTLPTRFLQRDYI